MFYCSFLVLEKEYCVISLLQWLSFPPFPHIFNTVYFPVKIQKFKARQDQRESAVSISCPRINQLYLNHPWERIQLLMDVLNKEIFLVSSDSVLWYFIMLVKRFSNLNLCCQKYFFLFSLGHEEQLIMVLFLTFLPCLHHLPF